jgi:hypothetical protein
MKSQSSVSSSDPKKPSVWDEHCPSPASHLLPDLAPQSRKRKTGHRLPGHFSGPEVANPPQK